MSYNDIWAKFHATMPDYYENIIRDISISELDGMLQSEVAENTVVTQDYVPIPRAGYQASIPDTYVDIPDVTAPVTTADDPIDAVNDIISGPDGADGEDGELPEPHF